ncbi:alpha/beta fold hydrolase [Sphingomonas sp. H39-1-10]|uniref:alpha/beta hydrolase family protein n=1 Tax=Sphingomonas pollutisoli TaxID=3030829 RepID=UPI0023B8E450|nr:alpha/beta fold hydrolase [Sphingomonas pollutisoli]MDF0488022.1 alpha/beta fold hydrolase [Sphingomonas pollutisoli]
MKYAYWAGLALLSTASQAGAASDAALRFGAREDVRQISISPDGKRIAYIAPTGTRGDTVIIATVATGELKAITASSGNPDRLQSCHWTTDTRLTCAIYMVVTDSRQRILPFSRIFALDADGKRSTMLSARTNDRTLGFSLGGGEIIDWQPDKADGSVLMTHTYIPEATTGSLVTSTQEGLGVDRIDTVTLKHTMVEPPRRGAEGYISDGHGTVRIMEVRGETNTGYMKDTVNVLYRTPDSRQWKPLSTVKQSGGVSTGFDPVAVDRDKNVAYGFDTVGGRNALYSVALDGSLKRELVLARPDVDVDDLVSVGRQNRMVGVGFATDKRQTVYFDPELAKLSASLSKALPGLPLVNIVDATGDESKLVIFAGSDVDPGRYYLYDKATRKLAELLPLRQALAKTPLASVKPVNVIVADGTTIPAYLTLPPGGAAKGLPAIVMPHGGPDARDEWGFDWLAQFFANRGYAVLQPNFRGSTGYGVAFFEKNGFQSWPVAVGDVNDSGRWLIKQGIADPAKLAVVGWSYGGYAALQSAVLDPALFKAIVAVAPVTDLESRREEWHEFTNYSLVDTQIGHGPHVQAGSPAQHADHFTAPVLLFHGDLDRNVAVAESRLMASRLKGAHKAVTYVEYPALDHQLEDNAVRADMLDKMDGFLRTTLVLPSAP